MATITGSLKYVTNADAFQRVTFTPTDTPKAVGSDVAIKDEPIYTTNATGDLPAGITLLVGKYTVSLSNGESFTIDVPSGSGTHDLASIIDSTGGTSDTSLYVRRVYAGIASVTIASAVESSLFGSAVGSRTLAANFFTVGKMLRVTVRGSYTVTATPGTFNLRLYFGSDIVGIVVTPGNSQTGLFSVTVYISCQTVGAAGVFHYAIEGALGQTDNTSKLFSIGSPAQIQNTTAALTVDLTLTWSGAGQSVTSDIGLVEAIP